MNHTKNFNNILKHNGLKVTKHRSSILVLLQASTQPLTAEDIYFMLKEDNIAINLSSVYRILDTLTEISLVNKFYFEENNKTLYEINNKEHKHHLICSGCRKVFPINWCPISKHQRELSEEMEFEITNHKIEIYGYCKECKGKSVSN